MKRIKELELNFLSNYFEMTLLGISSFTISTIFTLIFIKEKIIPNRYSNDHIKGSQKIHNSNIKRIGGLPIILSIISMLVIYEFFFKLNVKYDLLIIYIYCNIIFFVGFTEDLVKDIKPRYRLLALFLITFLWLINYSESIQNTNIDFVDNIIKFEAFAIILTIICIISTLNATNMMDGANGLLTIFVIIVNVILLFYASHSKDLFLINFLFILIGTLLGFLVFNWPKGRIFLGDGGSYFLGSILSTVLIYMSNEPNNFNMLNALIIMIYPVWELTFTVFRRIYFSSDVTQPDNLHLHTILHANIKKINLEKKCNVNNNALTGLIINIIALLPSIIFLIYKFDANLEDNESISFFIIIFSMYTIFYLSLIKMNKN